MREVWRSRRLGKAERLICASLLCALALAAPRQAVEGKVVRIVDGDTIDILVNRRTLRIRFYGIDAPERGQPYATQARRQLGDWIAGQQVRAVIVDRDRYGRAVARVQHQGKEISEQMVRFGLAWWYRHHAPHDRRLQSFEQEARRARRGLWLQPAVPPWEWRKH